MEGFSRKYKFIVPVLCFLLLSWTLVTLTHVTGQAYGADAELGKKVYQKYCVICHGAKGDGKGLMDVIHRNEKSGLVWSIYPRDFTVGTFKFRTTATGCLPDDSDLMRMITEGIPRSGMPSHEDVAKKDREAVVEYIKTLSPRWEEETSVK